MKDTVTNLRTLRKGYEVTFDSGERLYLSNADFRALPLALGDSLDLRAYRHDLLLRQYPEALNRAVGLLATRARSQAEVERRLTAAGYQSDTVEMVLYKLEKERLLDDGAFAQAWVAQRSARGLGAMRLRQELRQRGVDETQASAAIEALAEEDTLAQAQALAAKLYRRYAAEPQAEAKRKTLVAMQRRGYRYGEASRALQAMLERGDDDCANDTFDE